MERRRVVITGVGAITPLGNNVNEFWNSLLEGISGADFITHFDASKFKTKFACEVKNFDPANYFDRKELRKYDLVTTYGIVAANQAIQDANIKIDNLDPYRVGVIWSSGIGGIITFFQEVKNFVEGDGTPRFNPFFVPKMIIDITAGHISMIHGFKGPNYATVSACASSANAIVDAVLLIRHGYADVIVTGGCEAAITEPGMGGFNSMNAISVRNDDPKTASRPFDKDRDGFVMGEGAAGLIIEDLEHAKKRGAKIYAEILGFGLSADAYHITAPHPEGEGAKHAMSFTLQDASIEKEKIDHINTHGTATPAGDIAEAKAIVSVFGDHAQNISINSTKSMHGHLLGAAGAIEALATILSIQNDAVPPTINHFTDDPDIPKLDFTFNHKKERIVHYAISNTFGFGGHNVSLLFGKYSE
ncbi:MAG: beta-ketoacyl-ACP synthase II [Bacteroidales bacterium]|jgi:3-oxoacyl-[acyl-carrier-protein] synthase II|nr:beta-ketoacyl-ACP synthase II [Bacteroidales bacterium]MDI9575158.1 beta-ketoacyl-ACP synthase II [Bacteroidota bacterium]MDD3755726.1 beta-ketoacyl-ACP synthase II [Bacteroidales bacterium]MDY0400823.1 beta-ketoacyl-ACP synthase II [Bacteroidales bacterium]HHW60076.1 beta-ketoacyl-ACP synthase II [Bacteroidales bacterium]